MTCSPPVAGRAKSLPGGLGSCVVRALDLADKSGSLGHDEQAGDQLDAVGELVGRRACEMDVVVEVGCVRPRKGNIGRLKTLNMEVVAHVSPGGEDLGFVC